MNSLRLWVEVTVGGFPYVAAAFFIFLCFLGIHDLESIKPPPEYLPYIGVLLTMLSYAFGLSVHVISQQVYVIAGGEKKKYDAKRDKAFMEDANDYVLRHASFLYSTLVLFRLLASGTFILGVALSSWIGFTKFRGIQPAVVVFSGLLTALFVTAYFSHREFYIAFRDVESEQSGKTLKQKSSHRKRRQPRTTALPEVVTQ
jgi:hypothetical protein